MAKRKVKRPGEGPFGYPKRDWTILAALHQVDDFIQLNAIGYQDHYSSDQITTLFSIIDQKMIPFDFRDLLRRRLAEIAKRKIVSIQDAQRISTFFEEHPM